MHTLVIVGYVSATALPVVCENGALRLVSGEVSTEGTVQLCVNRAWSTVCSAGWGNDEANVVCRQLGFGSEGWSSMFLVHN